MKLFYDTETTGLPDWKSPSESEHQPHIVEIGAALLDDEFNIIEQYEAIVKPEGWEISEEMTAIHGISHERAMDEGVSEKEALKPFLHCTKKACCASAITYRLMIGSYALRLSATLMMSWPMLSSWPRNFCTMWESKQIVKAPFKDKKGVKNPNLAEAYKFFTGEDIADAHRAMGDVLSTIAVYKGLGGLEGGQ